MPQVVCGVRTKINQGWVREAYIKKIRIQKGIAQRAIWPFPPPWSCWCRLKEDFFRGGVFSARLKLNRSQLFFSYSENFSAAPKCFFCRISGHFLKCCFVSLFFREQFFPQISEWQNRLHFLSFSFPPKLHCFGAKKRHFFANDRKCDKFSGHGNVKKETGSFPYAFHPAWCWKQVVSGSLDIKHSQ